MTEKDMATAIVISDSFDEISEAATSQTSLMSFFRPRMANYWLNSSGTSLPKVAANY